MKSYFTSALSFITFWLPEKNRIFEVLTAHLAAVHFKKSNISFYSAPLGQIKTSKWLCISQSKISSQMHSSKKQYSVPTLVLDKVLSVQTDNLRVSICGLKTQHLFGRKWVCRFSRLNILGTLLTFTQKVTSCEVPNKTVKKKLNTFHHGARTSDFPSHSIFL